MVRKRSQQQIDDKNTRRRLAYLQKKTQNDNLITTTIVEENRPSKLFRGVDMSSTSSSQQPFDEDIVNRDEECMLYDVSVGIVDDLLFRTSKIQTPVIPTEAYKIPPVSPCEYCSAKRFLYEPSGFCCGQGTVALYPNSMPTDLQNMYLGSVPESQNFLDNIRVYNNAFSFTSCRVNLDPQVAKRVNGVYTFRAQGQIYHSIHSLIPSAGKPSFLQLYYYDTEHELTNRNLYPDVLHEPIFQKLIDILSPNPYSVFFRNLQRVPNIETCRIRLQANPATANTTSSAPTASQVAVIWNEGDGSMDFNERDIEVYKHDGQPQKIKYFYGCYDSLQYPLLFPAGEPGWHQGIHKVPISQRGLYSQEQGRVVPSQASAAEDLLRTEAAVYDENATKTNMVSAREYYAYRFQIRPSINATILQSGRLFQQFVVDMYVKIETSRLDFFRLNQPEIRAEVYQGIVDGIAQGETNGASVGKRIILPSSFIGGPRDMRKRYLDAMALVERYGKPDLFLTMTCNPRWPEITGELLKHEEVQNRPDLIVRIFRSKFLELKKEVLKKGLFGTVIAFTYVIEFQKRGLPHVHMLLILKDRFKLHTAEQVNEFISAELPGKEKYPHLHATVIKHMMHGPCGQLKQTNSCMRKGKCKDHYPRSYCEETSIADNGYPVYRRRPNQEHEKVMVRQHLLDNRWVVPYNPYLLAMFDCHINVEICSTIKAVKYLYKYIYKGHDKIIYKIISDAPNQDINEIDEYQSARWVSPPEAIWRTYRFPMHEMSPAVINLQLHLLNCQLITMKKHAKLSTVVDSESNKRTMLTEFFWMNAHNTQAREANLLYKHFPEQFVWDNKAKVWNPRKKQTVIGRIITANPHEGERYYLRLLLNHIPGPTSYEDLRTYKGIIYNTFKEATIAHDLLKDDQTNEKTMQEACAYQMPNALRQLFCVLLVHCNPTDPRKLFFRFEEEMVEDYTGIQKMPIELARQCLLTALQKELESMGKNY